jgi:hypothetical protein
MARRAQGRRSTARALIEEVRHSRLPLAGWVGSPGSVPGHPSRSRPRRFRRTRTEVARGDSIVGDVPAAMSSTGRGAATRIALRGIGGCAPSGSRQPGTTLAQGTPKVPLMRPTCSWRRQPCTAGTVTAPSRERDVSRIRPGSCRSGPGRARTGRRAERSHSRAASSGRNAGLHIRIRRRRVARAAWGG